MSQARYLWAVPVLAIEESLVAFSRVGPDLVGHSLAVRTTVRPADSSHSPAREQLQSAEDSGLQWRRGASWTKGSEGIWRSTAVIVREKSNGPVSMELNGPSCLEERFGDDQSPATGSTIC
jgi:hypothetical protein